MLRRFLLTAAVATAALVSAGGVTASADHTEGIRWNVSPALQCVDPVGCLPYDVTPTMFPRITIQTHGYYISPGGSTCIPAVLMWGDCWVSYPGTQPGPMVPYQSPGLPYEGVDTGTPPLPPSLKAPLKAAAADYEQSRAAWKSCPNGQYVQAVTKTMNTTRVTFTNTNNQATFIARYLGSTNWLGFQNTHTHTTLSWYQSAYVVVEAAWIDLLSLSCVYRA